MQKALISGVLGVLLLLLAGPSCKKRVPASSSLVYPDHPSVQVHNWDRALLRRPVVEKIQPLNDLAASYVVRWNEIDGFDERPSPAEMKPELKAALVRELAALPDPLQRFMQSHLFAIFTCKNLGGSAIAGVILDGKTSIGGFLILDVDVLNRPANDWISYKENTVFQPEPGLRYRVEMEGEGSNTVAAAMRFILVHELGHIFGQVKQVTLPFSEKYPVLSDSPFMVESWESVDGVSRPRGAPWAENVKFYRKEPPYKLSQAVPLYGDLRETAFATLYAVTDTEEDWAETFALYVHCVLLKKHYRVVFEENGKSTVLASDLILSDALKQKRRFVELALSR